MSFIDDDLPALPLWFSALRYRADDNTCTLTIRLPVVTELGDRTTTIRLEMQLYELDALHDLLAHVIETAESNARVLDVPALPERPDPS